MSKTQIRCIFASITLESAWVLDAEPIHYLSCPGLNLRSFRFTFTFEH